MFPNSFLKVSPAFVLKILGISGLIYLMGLLPLFFLYPNHGEPVKRNISRTYFHDLAEDLDGDCYRIAKTFIQECPFPAREIHLDGQHTIVEIQINGVWMAYDPQLQIFFDEQNVAQIAFDLRRGHVPPKLQNHPHRDAFEKPYYYHSAFFIGIRKVYPYYPKLVALYYNLVKA
jgi:hypothetical protein